ncbi:MAG: hypothetical protein Unbinned2990contig1001_15 [Prokaryotic dsDNA virus sp.]|nr:MAG: hypothetical protein Unbinned2990contig1001_15 [Prokaryotic dsDNA virus sp.]|tara:strand:+ start:2235 stop:2558 length:324 start_codon:yes stop_codon:yes gene_type:complete
MSKKMGRPKKFKIDEEQIEQLASFGCTNTEMASFFGCSKSLLTKTYSTNIAKGRDKGKIRLRQLQWTAAKNGNVSMLIWLGKQVLGQTEKTEVSWENPVDGVEFIDV